MARKEGDGELRHLVFFNQWDLSQNNIDPRTAVPNEDFGVAETWISREDFENEPIIKLLERADGFIMWRQTDDTKYYLYNIDIDRESGEINPGTPLNLEDGATLYDMNFGFDRNIYIMISTVDPQYTPGNPTIEPLPLRLRF